jgi:hypothetical protein
MSRGRNAAGRRRDHDQTAEKLQELSLTYLPLRYQGPIFLACKIAWKGQHEQNDLMSVVRRLRPRRLRFAGSIR